MPNKASKRLVIDASVARASGGPEATHPTATYCRDFLNAVLDISHRVVMTEDITTEWLNHASQFARKWRVRMEARKKVYRINITADATMRDKVARVAVSEKQQAEILKDCHLLEAALATDQIIIALDKNTARKFFQQAARFVRKLGTITWVDPTQADEQPIDWLRNGAKPERTRQLGFTKKTD